MARARKKKPVAAAAQSAEVDLTVEGEEAEDAELAADEELLVEEALSAESDELSSEEAEIDEGFEDEAPDLDEVLKSANDANLALRREIERKLEERRLAKDLDDLDFDLD